MHPVEGKGFFRGLHLLNAGSMGSFFTAFLVFVCHESIICGKFAGAYFVSITRPYSGQRVHV
jgi:hypothetical protein